MAQVRMLAKRSARRLFSPSELLQVLSSQKSAKVKQYAIGGTLFGTGLLSVFINAPLLGVAFCALGAYEISTGYWRAKSFSS